MKVISFFSGETRVKAESAIVINDLLDLHSNDSSVESSVVQSLNWRNELSTVRSFLFKGIQIDRGNSNCNVGTDGGGRSGNDESGCSNFLSRYHLFACWVFSNGFLIPGSNVGESQ